MTSTTSRLRKVFAERTHLNLSELELRWLAGTHQLAWESGPCMLGTLSIERSTNPAAPPGPRVRIVRYAKHPADSAARRGCANLLDTVSVSVEDMRRLDLELQAKQRMSNVHVTHWPVDHRGWCWWLYDQASGDIRGATHGPHPTRDEAVAAAVAESGETRFRVGRCTDTFDAIVMPSAETIRDIVADRIYEVTGDDSDDVSLTRDVEATHALHAWVREYIHPGTLWVGTNAEDVDTAARTDDAEAP